MYLPEDSDVTLEVEQFIQKYPEIGAVSYYTIDGSHLFSLSPNQVDTARTEFLDGQVRDELLRAFDAEGDEASLKKKLKREQSFEIIGLISVESISSDGLFDYALDDETSRKTPIGFVKLGLDFSWYQERLLINLGYACVVLLLLLVGSGLLGWTFLKKSLSSLSDLQRPISELARGNLDVQFERSAPS